MQSLLLILVVVVLAFGLWRLLARGTELMALEFRAGSVQVIRGRCPPSLLRELEDVARLESLDGARATVVSEAGAPRVTRCQSLSSGQIQQLRNAVGRFSVAQIRRAKTQG